MTGLGAGADLRSSGATSASSSPRRTVAPLAVGAYFALAVVTGAAVAVLLDPPRQLAIPFAAALLVPAGALLLGGVKRLLLAVIAFDLSLGVDVHLFYRDALGDLGALGGLNISLTTAALGGLYALWLVEALISPLAVNRLRAEGSRWAAAYIALVAVASLAAADKTLAGFELGLLVQLYLLVVYVVSNLSRDDVRFVVTALLLSVVLQAVITLATANSHLLFDLLFISNSIDASFQTGRLWRAAGTMGSPNTASAFFAMLIPPALALWLAPGRRRWGVLALAVITFGVTALVITRSRGGWLGLLMAATLVLVALLARRRLNVGALVGLLLLSLPLAPFVLPLVAQRVQLEDGGSLASRGPMNRTSWQMIKDSPVFGVGPNNYALVAEGYVGPDASRAWFYTVHNKYLLVWSESGPLALVAFLLFIAGGIRAAFVAARRDDSALSLVALGLGAAIIGQLLHFGFDIFNSRPVMQLLWLTIALLVALARGEPTTPRLRHRRGIAPEVRTTLGRAEPAAWRGS